MKDKLIVTISIDDVHPQSGWRILGDKTEKWLRSLNEKYGAKFTLFVPSNYHNRFPLSQHKEWVQELASIEWIELASHGHLHMTSDPKRFGECEFFELSNESDIRNRLLSCWDEWNACLHWEDVPIGWKSPGWLCSEPSKKIIENMFFRTTAPKDFDRSDMDFTMYSWGRPFFEYAALHYEHNHNMIWKGSGFVKSFKSFFGHDGIQQTNISIHNDDMIMLTSHIAGNWNHNVWNEQNYEQLCISLDHLVEKYDCEFKTLRECI